MTTFLFIAKLLLFILSSGYLYQGKYKNNKYVKPILIVFILTSGILTLVSLYDLISSPNSKTKVSKKNISRDANTSIINDKLLIAHEKKPILDNNLYVGQYFAEFIVGGVNLKDIKINARTKKGEPLDIFLVKYINKSYSQHEDTVISIEHVFASPYIEFEYKNQFYSIQINSEVTDYANGEMENTFSLNKIKKSTMSLHEYTKLSMKE